MNYRESISVGFLGLKAHKLRSVLTTLGIIFGVAAVIAMLSIGEGAKQEALKQIKLMGINNIIVNDVSTEIEQNNSVQNNGSRGLCLEDAFAIKQINPLVDDVLAQRIIEKNIYYDRNSVKTKIVGTTPDFERMMSYYSENGNFFTYLDLIEIRRVCVLGVEIKNELFHFQNAVGKQIKIDDQWFTVVGVMQHKEVAGNMSETSFNLNRNIYIPLTCALKRFPIAPLESQINQLLIRVKNAEQIKIASNMVKQTLDRKHHGIEDYEIIIPEVLLKQKQKTQRIFNIVMGAIAGISLIVGGIGIMNIMLASVFERTREIGIRRAVGATRKDILGQFLVEAVVLSFAGGLLGLILGFGIAKIITWYAGWRTIVSIFSLFLAFSVSAAIGIIFGLYPARKAAMLDPIESVRYE